MELFGAKLQYEAAMKYYKGSGQGFTRNRSKAFKLFKEAAEAGLVEAMMKLSEMYKKGEGCTKDDNEAFVWLVRAADKGNAEAQYQVACSKLDYSYPYSALEYYEKAANQGHTGAIVEMGIIYASKLCEYDKAIHWLSQPSLQNNPTAIYYLAKAHENKEKTDLHPFAELYECIDGEHDIYVEKEQNKSNSEKIETYQPSNQVKNLYKKALRFYEHEASFGDWESVLLAANMYLKGEGCEVDYDKAFNYLNHLANQPQGEYKGKNHEYYREEALIKLAKMHELGLGCEKNIDKCNELLNELNFEIDEEWFKSMKL